MPPRCSALGCEASDNRHNRRGPLSSFTALRDLVARSPGCSVSKSVVIFLHPTIFISNLIGDNGSLEQPAPSSLQVTMSFDGILERAGRDVY